jgi:hypothetical protein
VSVLDGLNADSISRSADVSSHELRATPA